jgi:hypothetical protein
VRVLRIPGEFDTMPFVDPGGKPRGSERAGEGLRRGRPDIIEFSVSGGASARVTSRMTGTARESVRPDSGARARIEQHMADGVYDREEVIAGVAYELLDLFGI